MIRAADRRPRRFSRFTAPIATARGHGHASAAHVRGQWSGQWAATATAAARLRRLRGWRAMRAASGTAAACRAAPTPASVLAHPARAGRGERVVHDLSTTAAATRSRVSRVAAQQQRLQQDGGTVRRADEHLQQQFGGRPSPAGQRRAVAVRPRRRLPHQHALAGQVAHHGHHGWVGERSIRRQRRKHVADRHRRRRCPHHPHDHRRELGECSHTSPFLGRATVAVACCGAALAGQPRATTPLTSASHAPLASPSTSVSAPAV